MEAPLPSRTFDDLVALAEPYSTPTEFFLAERMGYRVAQERGLLDDVLDRVGVTEAAMSDEAAKFRYLGEYLFGCRPSYMYAKRCGFLYRIIDRICPTMEELQQFAFEYPSRASFRRGNLPAYRYASDKGLLDQLFVGPAPKPDPNSPTYLYVHRLGKRVYVGITYDPELRISKHLKDSVPEVWEVVAKGTVTYFCRADAVGEVRPYAMPRYKAERLEKLAILYHVAHGFEVTNRKDNPQYNFATKTWRWKRTR